MSCSPTLPTRPEIVNEGTADLKTKGLLNVGFSGEAPSRLPAKSFLCPPQRRAGRAGAGQPRRCGSSNMTESKAGESCKAEVRLLQSDPRAPFLPLRKASPVQRLYPCPGERLDSHRSVTVFPSIAHSQWERA